MSKTGGGIGTNQYKIQGTSQAKRSCGAAGESSVALAAEPPGLSAGYEDTQHREVADDLARRLTDLFGDGWESETGHDTDLTVVRNELDSDTPEFTISISEGSIEVSAESAYHHGAQTVESEEDLYDFAADSLQRCAWSRQDEEADLELDSLNRKLQRDFHGWQVARTGAKTVDFASVEQAIHLRGPDGRSFSISQIHRNPIHVADEDSVDDYIEEYDTDQPVTEYHAYEHSGPNGDQVHGLHEGGTDAETARNCVLAAANLARDEKVDKLWKPLPTDPPRRPTENELRIAAVIAEQGITGTAKRMGEAASNDPKPIYAVTLTNSSGQTYSTPWTSSDADGGEPPNIHRVLDTAVGDAHTYDESAYFHEWAENMGYDLDDDMMRDDYEYHYDVTGNKRDELVAFLGEDGYEKARFGDQ